MEKEDDSIELSDVSDSITVPSDLDSKTKDDDNINLIGIGCRVPETFSNLLNYKAHSWGISKAELIRFFLKEQLKRYRDGDVPEILKEGAILQSTSTEAGSHKGLGDTIKVTKNKFDEMRSNCVKFAEDGLNGSSIYTLSKIFNLLFKLKKEKEFIYEDFISIWKEDKFDGLKDTEVWEKAKEETKNEVLEEIGIR